MPRLKPGQKVVRHIKGPNSTDGWTPKARAAAAKRMKKIRKEKFWNNNGARSKTKHVGRPKGSKNKGWTKAAREARSEASKKMWAEASPEKRARMHTNWQSKGFETWDAAKRRQAVKNTDQKAKGRKVSETRKRKIANGEIDLTPQRIALRKAWDALTPAEQLERINALQAKRKLKGKHRTSNKAGSKSYESQQYQNEQTRLYQLAEKALKPYGIEPKPKQEIGYYRAIIEQLRPDWVKWEV